MEKHITKHLREMKLSFSFISLAVLLGFTAVVAVANAQENDATAATNTVTETNNPEPVAGNNEDAFDDLRAEKEARANEAAQKKDEKAAAKEEKQAEVAEKKSEMQEEKQAKIAERKSALNARAKDRITKLAANITNRLDAIFARLEQIISRFDSRLATLKEKGVDTSAAESKVAEAKAHLDAAKEKLENIDAYVTTVAEGNDPRTAWTEAKVVLKDIQNEIKAAHSALREALAAAKAALATERATRAAQEDTNSDVTETE